jgi:nifR3 family TIM-barrel protein
VTPLSSRAAAAAPLRVGPFTVDPPVVLAPMAGVTNTAFRRLCREFGGGLYVSEMITSRALVERDDETMRMLAFGPDERPRSVQLYGVDPGVVGRAVAVLVAEDRADHVDLNFGCPVAKVTRKGGGAALPYRRGLLRAIVRAAVRAAGDVPVTVKTRTGIDDDHLTYLDAGRIAEDEGAAAVALHGRTASQFYAGDADWSAIARLKEAVTSIPVLGNGDLWTASDALRMTRETGCDGVVVGRGCLGRPWLFRSLEAVFAGLPDPGEPPLGEVASVMRRHARLLADHRGEHRASREFRKHAGWYLKGFPVGSATRTALGGVDSLAGLDALLDDVVGRLGADAAYPAEVVSGPRGKSGGGGRRVVLPEGWLDDPESASAPAAGAELAVSGG